MNHYRQLCLGALLLLPSYLHAANYTVEARGDGMGEVGTVSASYLTAPFYNPAIAAIYRRNDDLGMIAPGLGGQFSDENELLDQIDDIADLIDSSDPSAADAVRAVDGDSFNFELGAVAAVGIPNSYLAATLYGKVYAESFVTPRVDDSDPANDSIVESLTFGLAEVGVSLARYSQVLNQHMSFGITPKLQKVYTYSYGASFENFDAEDIIDNSTTETLLNFDAGMLWFYGPYRIGLAGKNLIGHEIDTKHSTVTAGSRTWDLSYQYSMKPLFTVGAGIVADYFTASIDYDLNEEKKFIGVDDDTQMLRAGVEFDLIRFIKLRAGYMHNMARETDDTLTAGVGLNLLKLLEVDVAAQYTNENSMGASVNFLATY